MGEGAVWSGAFLRVDANAEEALFTALKAAPRVAVVTTRRAVLATFRALMAENILRMRVINAVFAGIANVSGELTPVASVAAALGVPGDGIHTHFIVIGDAGARWAFGSARIEGVRRVDESRIVPAPTTVRHAADA
jgi:hypothetical protein